MINNYKKKTNRINLNVGILKDEKEYILDLRTRICNRENSAISTLVYINHSDPLFAVNYYNFT